MWLIILVLVAITIATLFSHLEGNSIVIDTSIRDGPSRECDMPFSPGNLLIVYCQFQMKFVRITGIVSKRYNDVIARCKLLFRNIISYKLSILRKVRCRGPFLGMRFGVIEASIS